MFEVKIISGREHFQPSRWRIECAVASAFFWIASASSRSRTFSSGKIQGRTWQNKSWFRRDAETNTRNAYAPQITRRRAA
ncbi:MAG: hypothetical protein DME52_10690 [Verrucomicrobia bacterium]|nr:MAG: hypothetical protein DME52_10690 [Verrucomicrobiota bacterium]